MFFREFCEILKKQALQLQKQYTEHFKMVFYIKPELLCSYRNRVIIFSMTPITSEKKEKSSFHNCACGTQNSKKEKRTNSLKEIFYSNFSLDLQATQNFIHTKTILLSEVELPFTDSL